MQVNGLGNVGQPGQDPATQRARESANSASRSSQSSKSSSTGGDTDQVELSSAGLDASRSQEIAQTTKELEEIRPEKVELAKDLIASGALDQEDRLEATAEHIASVLGAEL